MAETRQLFINLKTQDKLREWFSKRNSIESLTLTNMSLGDSDINYELSNQINKIEILPAPYQIPRIKHKLTYEGIYSGLEGEIKIYTRKIDSSGNILSQYKARNEFIKGTISPLLKQAYDIDSINFSQNQESYVLFLETLPTGYKDSKNNLLRLKEDYEFVFTYNPESYDIIIGLADNINKQNEITFSDTSVNTNNILGIGNIIALQSNYNKKLNGLFKIKAIGNNNKIYITDIYDQPLNIDIAEIKEAKLYLYQTTIDKENNSLIISKGLIKPNAETTIGELIITGKLSGIKKIITIYYY